MTRVEEASLACVVAVVQWPSAATWIARCESCGWRSQPSRYRSEAEGDAYEHEHPRHGLPLELLAPAYEVEQRNRGVR